VPFHTVPAVAVFCLHIEHSQFLGYTSKKASDTMSDSKATQDANVAWYDKDPTDDRIPQATRKLLETYSGIPPDEVFGHVLKLRDDAWKVHPYPCIGQFRFLEPSFTELGPEFDEVVDRLGRGQKLLDMACCFGQTIRQLVASGAPAENIYGCDLHADFIDLGYKLFKDDNKLQAKFLTADIFDSNSALKDLQGSIDMVYAGSFFHLWGFDKQVEVSKSVAALLRPEPGSMILGRQIGAVEAAEQVSATGTMYRHNPESFKKMWKEIGEDLGIDFTVDASLKPLQREHSDWHTNGTKRLWFVVRRK
jgi:SAM-dependent methyltransferase